MDRRRGNQYTRVRAFSTRPLVSPTSSTPSEAHKLPLISTHISLAPRTCPQCRASSPRALRPRWRSCSLLLFLLALLEVQGGGGWGKGEGGAKGARKRCKFEVHRVPPPKIECLLSVGRWTVPRCPSLTNKRKTAHRYPQVETCREMVEVRLVT